jgi:hypothetical protein
LEEAVGEIVHNLGFLSTSSSIEAALIFKANILYEIKVINFREDGDWAPGFADVSSFSDYYC